MLATQLILDDLRRRCRDRDYDPGTGTGCIGKRVAVLDYRHRQVLVPASMKADTDYRPDLDKSAWQRLRCRHDFEYWCAKCVTSKDKTAGKEGPFILNAPQRRVAAILESDRLAGQPLRLILLKARQWGGSTLVQMYMAWIQSCHRHNWNSLICAHVKDTASGIRGM